MKKLSSLAGTAALLIFTLTACSTTSETKLFNEWSDNSYRSSKAPLNRILVLGVTESSIADEHWKEFT